MPPERRLLLAGARAAKKLTILRIAFHGARPGRVCVESKLILADTSEVPMEDARILPRLSGDRVTVHH